MFGFGKKKSDPPEKSSRRTAEYKDRKSQNLAQLGFLAGVGDDGDIDNLMGNMDVGDEDLEEELAMLLNGKQPPVRTPKSSPPKKPANAGRTKGVVNPINFNVDVNEDDDDDGDLDLDDPDLEAELGDILGMPTVSRSKVPVIENDDDDESEETPPPQVQTMSREQLVNLLQERLQLYENAKRTSDSSGDLAKSRRFTRGIKTLQELLLKAKAGRVVDEANIPPVVSIGIITKEKEVSTAPPSSQPVDPPIDYDENTPDKPKQVPVQPPPLERKSPYEDNARSELPPPLVPTRTPITPGIQQLQVHRMTVVEEDKSNHEMDQSAMLVNSGPPDPAFETRVKEYKHAAVTLKRQGDVQGAVKFLKLSKQLESAMKTGNTLNIHDYPSIDSIFGKSPESSDQTSVVPDPQVSMQQEPTKAIAEVSQSSDPAPVEVPPGEDIFGAPPPPKTVMEALEQRLNKYKSEVEKANSTSNSSKARRMGRIVKQYEEAIMLYKKGKSVVFDELPTPPGFAPIPLGVPALPPSVPVARPQQPESSSSTTQGTPSTPEKKPRTDSNSFASGTTGSSPGTSGSTISRGGKPPTKLTLQEKQLQIIQLRQQQFREAAINAKKRGDLNQARVFLKTSKGFDKLIQVAQAGLPVDMATLPAPPEAVAALNQMEEDNFEVISASDCIMPSGDAAEIYPKLEADLKQQLKMCMRTRDHFKSIGDVGSANRFESMALESKRDLDALRLAMKKNSGIPKYHYENKIFSITECNTDIGEDEIEVSIIQGVNYKVSNPSDVDTFVKIELPYPSAEETQSNKTGVVKDTNSPVYNATYKLSINRTARNFQRFVHRHGFKCEVWAKGGFLRGNTLIGTAAVKLLPLETKCTLHDAFDILDGRKVVGKLEVKVRIREPVLTKQITQKKEKWLSIDRA